MKDFIIDFETFDSSATAMVIDCAVVPFDPDPTIVQSFDELTKQGKRVKFSLASQKGVRTVNPDTVAWWKIQVPEAKKNLVPSDSDLTVEDGTIELLDFLKSSGVDLWKSQGWCRGQSFDFPIFTNLMQQTFKTRNLEKVDPIKFWNQRDIRTAIEALSLTRGMMMTPLRNGLLDGFVAHDSIHDCAKDILMLKTAWRYAMGLEEIPPEGDIDPQTVSGRKR